MSSRPVYRMCAQVAPSGECLWGKGRHDGMLAKPWCRLFLAASGLNLVVNAVLRDSLCVVSLLPCMADCCMLYTMCEVEQFVLTIIKRRLLLLLLSVCWYSQKYSSQNFCICSLIPFFFLTLSPIYFKHAPESITPEYNWYQLLVFSANGLLFTPETQFCYTSILMVN